MDKFQIHGPRQLKGEVYISGAKNSALPILFATLLTTEPVEIRNVPNLKDVDITIRLLHQLGVKIEHRGTIFMIDASTVSTCCVAYDLVKSIRASIWILAPLVARFGYGEVFFPGGCCIGKRPIDLHVSGLKKLGANVELESEYIKASVSGRLRGAYVVMDKVSVGATVSIMSAASLASGITVIENAAQEPEIIDIANFLITLGTHIIGAGSNRIVIEGVQKLHGGIYYIIPDRIETGTFLVGAAISRGDVICRNSNPLVLKKVLIKLYEAGAKITIGNDWVRLNMYGRRPRSVFIETAPYPGFPTDMQAQFSVLNIVAKGTGVIIESIFENRFMHIPELIRMGANVNMARNNMMICYGVESLFGTHVMGCDLRGSASLVLAGCIAEGMTTVHSVNHIDRGYDSLDVKLCNIGADIERIFSD